MIGRAGKETNGGEPGPAAILHFLFDLVSVVVMTTSESLAESACLRRLRFTLVDGAKSIDCAGDAFTGGNVFTGVGFSL